MITSDWIVTFVPGSDGVDQYANVEIADRVKFCNREFRRDSVMLKEMGFEMLVRLRLGPIEVKKHRAVLKGVLAIRVLFCGPKEDMLIKLSSVRLNT